MPPLAAALGGTFQYFGWFTLVCFALQGGFGALLCSLFAGGLFAPLAGVARLCRQPCFDRTRVPAHLTGGAMACAGSVPTAILIVCKRQGLYASRGLFCSMFLAVGIHPYFSAHDLRRHAGASVGIRRAKAAMAAARCIWAAIWSARQRWAGHWGFCTARPPAAGRRCTAILP